MLKNITDKAIEYVNGAAEEKTIGGGGVAASVTLLKVNIMVC